MQSHYKPSGVINNALNLKDLKEQMIEAIARRAAMGFEPSQDPVFLAKAKELGINVAEIYNEFRCSLDPAYTPKPTPVVKEVPDTKKGEVAFLSPKRLYKLQIEWHQGTRERLEAEIYIEEHPELGYEIGPHGPRKIAGFNAPLISREDIEANLAAIAARIEHEERMTPLLRRLLNNVKPLQNSSDSESREGDLSDQLVVIGIQFERLGLNWDHPMVVRCCELKGFEVEPRYGSVGYPEEAIQYLTVTLPRWLAEEKSKNQTMESKS